MNLKYIDEGIANGIANLLRVCKELNNDIVFKIYDSESFVGKSRDIDTILNMLDGGDEYISIHCCILADNGHLVEDLGWFGIAVGETDWLYNYKDCAFCTQVEKALDKLDSLC